MHVVCVYVGVCLVWMEKATGMTFPSLSTAALQTQIAEPLRRPAGSIPLPPTKA